MKSLLEIVTNFLKTVPGIPSITDYFAHNEVY